MRKILSKNISDLVSRLCIEANIKLRPDIRRALKGALKREKNRNAKETLRLLLKNADIAARDEIPICQDTGFAVVFMEVGQEIQIIGDSLKDAVNGGVRDGYRKGYLRKSVVSSPLLRVNTNTNTPAILHTSIIPGESVKIWVMPKGFGSENMSSLCMLNPSDREEGIIDFVVDAVKKAGPEACPPFVIGVGIGGTFDYTAFLAKKALLNRIDRRNPERRLAILENKVLDKINKLGIGPMGLGGKTTALGVNVLSFATHIAGLPVAVNVSCHATRSAYGVL